MTRWITVLVLAVASTATRAHAQQYTGPPSLGPFRIDKNVSMSSMFERLGVPSSAKAETFCYRSAQSKAFLMLTGLDPVYDDPKTAGAVTLSTVRNCVRHPVQVTTADIARWKTDKGIGLFSSEEQIVAAYGAPTREARGGGTNCGLLVYGDEDAASEFSSSRADGDCKVLVYKGTPTEQLSTAEFGLKNGRVIWIMLSQNE